MAVDNKVEYVLGGEMTQFRPFEPFAEPVVRFLNDFSEALRESSEANSFSDIMTLAFWCRRGNINHLRKEFDDGVLRFGLGTVFHIAPSNVPINFAFSYFFGLLAGNANVVRLPSRDFQQVSIICDTLEKLLRQEEHSEIARMTAFVRYGHDDGITRQFSMGSQARVVWGGDATVGEIRRIETSERGVDIAFRDRYSLCVVDSDALVMLGMPERKRLSEAFYNDTYLMDQNACSSPHLILWLGNSVDRAQVIFWEGLLEVVEAKYELAPIRAVDKHYALCRMALELHGIGKCRNHGNLIHRIQLDELPTDVTKLRGRNGLFFEFHAGDLNCLEGMVTDRFQTLTYFGVSLERLGELYRRQRWVGIDRIVPIGRALDIGLVWDGYDVIRALSRRVVLQ